MPSSLKTIGKQAFLNCSALRHLELPEGLESVGETAFGASGLTSLVIPESVVKIGPEICYQYGDLTEAVIKARVTTLPRHSFCSCPALQKVVLPETVESFGRNAFWGDVALSDKPTPLA